MVRGDGEYGKKWGGRGSVVRVGYVEFQNGSKGEKVRTRNRDVIEIKQGPLQ